MRGRRSQGEVSLVSGLEIKSLPRRGKNCCAFGKRQTERETDLVGYFHFLRSLITAIQCLKPLLPLRLMTKIPNGGTNREEGR